MAAMCELLWSSFFSVLVLHRMRRYASLNVQFTICIKTVTIEPTFLCPLCDSEHERMKSGEHKSTHGVVRWLASVDAQSQREEQLNARINTLETSLKDILYKVQEGITSVVKDRIPVT